ncbi:hypothetical protein CCR94_16275 [Rhodoblastus sphagnicola]|uniref:Phage tail fibre protein N-terminal domain-containing protein n=1 Tax=Rhodoblastus sphagnicola TaxID=333368 RepID=A0A2S6N2X5_9HYPH|nr:phage tail protein [Rhodoblastus sphagnicola]MBB4199050.1 phage-related tail fiber protein [Rhodoblastus sphagnicola]PPQ28946.1 hypothetical protein CCR94_16275 [Rhodoblastus sphagnicola]
MTYGSKTTAKYKQRVTAAEAGGAKVQFVSFAVGDGNGAVPLLGSIESGLIHMVYAAPIMSASVNPGNLQQIDIVCPLPAVDGSGNAIGPFWIREVAILDEQGNVVVVANTQIEKSTSATGQVSAFNLTVSVSVDDATPLILTPAVTYATSDDVLSIDAALATLLQAIAQADQTILMLQGHELKHRAALDKQRRRIDAIATAINLTTI